MEVGGQGQTPAGLTPGKNTVPVYTRLDELRDLNGKFREILLPRGSNPKAFNS
jgi:hypothetical protein